MAFKEERRKYPRDGLSESVFVKIIACDTNPQLVGKTFFSSTANVSKGGIRFRSGFRIEQDTVAELCIGLSSRLQSFILTGAVRWCREHEPRRNYSVGIEFLADSKNLREWQSALEHLQEPKS